MMITRFTVTIALLASAALAPAQDRSKQHKTSNAPFLKPEEAVARMSIPDGFEVKIFASEPDIGEPEAAAVEDGAEPGEVEVGEFEPDEGVADEDEGAEGTGTWEKLAAWDPPGDFRGFVAMESRGNAFIE